MDHCPAGATRPTVAREPQMSVVVVVIGLLRGGTGGWTRRPRAPCHGTTSPESLSTDLFRRLQEAGSAVPAGTSATGSAVSPALLAAAAAATAASGGRNRWRRYHRSSSMLSRMS